ncbi:hypothetical protein MNBD_GAMMA13-1800 [hydrothermal vent metagenome]|uniref:Uncharacterized protein n=1 Tax=hydrothermal vent metagenome TaxID=652676 RepID=A0A3B0ZA56_9ZZZZ
MTDACFTPQTLDFQRALAANNNRDDLTRTNPN